MKKLKQTHAQVETPVQGRLSKILAAKAGAEVEENFGPYKTKDVATYEEYIRNLSRADLEGHCDRVGVIPAGESPLIVRKLLTEFKRHWQGEAAIPQPWRPSAEQKEQFASIMKGRKG